MKDGFLKAAAFSPALRVADCTYNAQQILADVQAAFFVSLTTLSLFVWAGLWYTEQNPAAHVSAGALIQQTGCEILR